MKQSIIIETKEVNNQKQKYKGTIYNAGLARLQTMKTQEQLCIFLYKFGKH